MDLKLLHVFTSVVRAGSISAAARQLNFSQPGVSQYVKSLEREVGAQLFTRNGGQLQITAAGQLLYKQAEDLLANWQFVCEQVQAVGTRTDVRRLHVCSFPSARILLVDAIRQMLTEDGQLRVQITEAEPPRNLDLLRTTECDALITFSYADDRLPRGYRSLPILTESFVLLLPADHPLARRSIVTLTDCRHEQWISGCPRCSKELVESCMAHGYDPEIVCSTDDPEATNQLVAAGVGIALRPALNSLHPPAPGVAVVGVRHSMARRVSIVAREADTSGYPEHLRLLMTKSAEQRIMGLPAQQRGWFEIFGSPAAPRDRTVAGSPRPAGSRRADPQPQPC